MCPGFPRHRFIRLYAPMITNRFNRSVRYSAWLALACLLFSPVWLAAQPIQLTVLHTNDIHAGFLPHEAAWIRSSPKPLVGGFRELARVADSIRAVREHVILLDGGDVMTGRPISDYPYMDTEGGALFAMMNMVGYDAWTIGNHDLDISQQNLIGLTKIARFPTLSANLRDTAGAFPLNNKPYVIINRGGIRIGIIGLMSPDLFELTNTNNLRGLTVLDPVTETQKIVDEIDPQTDLLIALTHQGVDVDSMLAMATKGLDVIIGGHSHTRLTSPKFVNGVIIGQTGSNCENLGELNITVENDSVLRFEGKLHSLWMTGKHSTDSLGMLIDDMEKKVNEEYGDTIGTLSTDWKRSGSSESNIGAFVAGALREAAKANIGITNSSGIRKELAAGPIRKLDLFEISPFRNYVTRFSCTGAELKAMATRYVESLSSGRSSIQLSGLEASWRKADGVVELMGLKVNGKDIDDATVYSCATSDFLINQAEKYLGFTPSSSEILITTMYEALTEKVQREQIVSGVHEAKFPEMK